jgi:hypothetical protein
MHLGECSPERNALRRVTQAQEHIIVKMKTIIRSLSLLGIASTLLVGAAGAATITFNTDSAGTKFTGNGLVQNSSFGAAATLTFSPVPDIATGVPSNINLGTFQLLCNACSTQALAAGAVFNAFTFELVVTDVTDGASGIFMGTSAGGTVFSDVSPLTINWAPLTLGPGALNAATGNFGLTVFTTTVFTGVPAPNGENNGQVSVQGTVNSRDAETGVPEPASMALLGSALVGIVALRRSRARSNRD